MHHIGVVRRFFLYVPARHLATERHGLIGPAVKLLFYRYGLNSKDVYPTGPKQNILKSDVMNVILAQNLKPVERMGKTKDYELLDNICSSKGSEKCIGGFIDIPLTNMRKTIAKRLSQAKQNIPHEYVAASVIWDEVTSFHKQLKEEGLAISINDVIIKAVANSLLAVPQVNVTWREDSIVSNHSVDVSVAVATSSGLFTPIIFSADNKGLMEISQAVRELAKKAKDGRLAPNEFQGGTFTISNLGMFGSVTGFSAIINEPQAAILTVGCPVYEMNERKITERRCTLTLCYDSRAISSAVAHKFISHLSESLRQPLLLTTNSPNSYTINDQVDYAKLL